MTPRCIVLIGLSVRAAAEAARRDGWRVIGLDAFGDADTRAACHHWEPLALQPDGSPCAWQLDLAGLDHLLRRIGPPRGAWLLPGSGLPREGATLGPWLEAWQAGLGLRWAGSDPSEVAALRDPRRFFPVLDLLGVAHPGVSLSPPPVAAAGEWLVKDFATSGGASVQPALPRAPASAEGPVTGYWQRLLPGLPLSLTVLADGQRAALLGLNRQRLAPTPTHPWRFGGVAGPLPCLAPARLLLQGWADRLAAHFRLRGLFSLDLVGSTDAAPESFHLLEVNPRWPASAQLYGGVYGGAGGLMNATVNACEGRLPTAAELQRLRHPPGSAALRGWAIAYSPCATTLDSARLQSLLNLQGGAHPHTAHLCLHDLPAPGPESVFLGEGDPLCSVSVGGADLATVQQRIDRALQHIRTALLQPHGGMPTKCKTDLLNPIPT